MRFMVFRMYGGTKKNPTPPRINFDTHYLCVSASGHAEAAYMYDKITGWNGRVHTIKVTNRQAKRETTERRLERSKVGNKAWQTRKDNGGKSQTSKKRKTPKKSETPPKTTSVRVEKLLERLRRDKLANTRCDMG